MSSGRGPRESADYELWELEGNDCGPEMVTIGGALGFSRLWLMLKTCVEDRSIPVWFDAAAKRLLRGAAARFAESSSGVTTARTSASLPGGG